jgi:hypothetical protein
MYTALQVIVNAVNVPDIFMCIDSFLCSETVKLVFGNQKFLIFCHKITGLCLYHWYISQIARQLSIPVQIVNSLFPAFHNCFCVLGLPSHRTADHTLSLFFKMVNSGEEVHPYCRPLLL